MFFSVCSVKDDEKNIRLLYLFLKKKKKNRGAFANRCWRNVCLLIRGIKITTVILIRSLVSTVTRCVRRRPCEGNISVSRGFYSGSQLQR